MVKIPFNLRNHRTSSSPTYRRIDPYCGIGCIGIEQDSKLLVLLLVSNEGIQLYQTVAPITVDVPIVNKRDNWTSLKIIADNKDERMMDRDVAKPFNRLSALFITTDTIRPPRACRATTLQTSGLYPTVQP